MKCAPSIRELTRQNVETIAKIERAFQDQRTVGERLADFVAAAIGSWIFIVIQSSLLLVWMALNVLAWSYHWDPYPFILLNLVLSFQAAYASPIIMVSQNRQARLNDRRNHLDLQINLLAEQENTEMLKLLRLICKKLDIPLAAKTTLGAFQQVTDPEEVLRQIESCVECEEDVVPPV